MKLNTFYLEDISDYDDFFGMLFKGISEKYTNIELSSISISLLISYLKKELINYIKVKYNKDVKIFMFAHNEEEKLVQKNPLSDNELKIILNKKKIADIILGDLDTLEEVLYQLIDEIDVAVKTNNQLDEIKYLISQMNNLVSLCSIELKTKLSSDEITDIIKNNEYNKFSLISPIFNDYYQCYLNKRKKLFNAFYERLIATF